MNLPMIGEETFLIYMVLSALAGALLGFALGFGLKEGKHSDEMASVMRIAKRIAETRKGGPPMVFQANIDPAYPVKKEGTPKGPPLLTPGLWMEKEGAPKGFTNWNPSQRLPG